MGTTGSEVRADVIGRVVAHASKRLTSEQLGIFTPFVECYYSRIDPADLAERHVPDLYGAAMTHLTFGHVRRPGEIRARAYAPDLDRYGYVSPHSVVELVVDEALVEEAVEEAVVEEVEEPDGCAGGREVVLAVVLVLAATFAGVLEPQAARVAARPSARAVLGSLIRRCAVGVRNRGRQRLSSARTGARAMARRAAPAQRRCSTHRRRSSPAPRETLRRSSAPRSGTRWSRVGGSRALRTAGWPPRGSVAT